MSDTKRISKRSPFLSGLFGGAPAPANEGGELPRNGRASPSYVSSPEAARPDMGMLASGSQRD